MAIQFTMIKFTIFVCLINFIILLYTTCEAVIFKDSPIIINTEQEWEFITGSQALTSQYLIGKGKNIGMVLIILVKAGIKYLLMKLQTYEMM